MYLRSLTRRADEAVSAAKFAHQPPGVARGTFLGIVWAGSCLSSIFLLFRLISRFRAGPRKLFLDDGLAIFAWILVLVTAALWQRTADDMYYVLKISAGVTAPGADFFPRLTSFARVQFAVEFCFHTTLLAVKLSFLFFFRRLGQRVQGQQYIWWPVLFFAVVGYAVSVGDIQYTCELGPAETLVTYCNSATATNYTAATLKINCALDVFSDFLIMMIPITILWNVRIPLGRKTVFIGLFSLTLITIVIAIVRAVDISVTRRGTGREDTSFLWLWTAIQASLAVVISCLSSFPQLFNQGKAKQKPVWVPMDTYYRRLQLRMKVPTKKNNTDHDLSSTISVPARSLPEFDSRRGQPEGHTQFSASYDSLEMPPEEPQQPWQPQKAEKSVVGMPHAFPPQDSLVTSYVGDFPDNGIEVPEKGHITKHITYSVTNEPATLYYQDSQRHV